MIGYSKNNRKNCPRKWFWWKEKETRVKIKPWVSANRPSNNWAKRSNLLRQPVGNYIILPQLLQKLLAVGLILGNPSENEAFLRVNRGSILKTVQKTRTLWIKNLLVDIFHFNTQKYKILFCQALISRFISIISFIENKNLLCLIKLPIG